MVAVGSVTVAGLTAEERPFEYRVAAPCAPGALAPMYRQIACLAKPFESRGSRRRGANSPSSELTVEERPFKGRVSRELCARGFSPRVPLIAYPAKPFE